MDFVSEVIGPDNGGLAKGTPGQAKIYMPQATMGVLSTTDDSGYYVYVNESNKVKLDIKFTLEPTLLSMLLKNSGTRRLAINIMVKSASETTVNYLVNGAVLYNGDEVETLINEDGDQLYLELPAQLAVENILTLETMTPAANLGLLFVSLEITDHDRSIAV